MYGSLHDIGSFYYNVYVVFRELQNSREEVQELSLQHQGMLIYNFHRPCWAHFINLFIILCCTFYKSIALAIAKGVATIEATASVKVSALA